MELDKVLKFVYEKHKLQVDKSGNPYILHVVSVALHMDTEEEKIVALLHDVLEDTDTTVQELYQLGLSKKIVDAIEVLTRSSKDTYMEYIEKVSSNKLAKSVKLRDLENNMDLSRSDNITKEILDLQKRYKKAYDFLKK